MIAPFFATAILLQANSQPWWLGPLALLFLLGFATAGYLLWSRRRRLDAKEKDEDWYEERSSLPPLIFPPRPASPAGAEPSLPSSGAAAVPEPETDASRHTDPPATRPAADDQADQEPGSPITDSVRVAPTPIRFSLLGSDAQSRDVAPPPGMRPPAIEPADTTTAPAEDRAARAEPGPDGMPDADATIPASAGSVRFHRPADGTLQLLPGRLEVLDQAQGVHEIRFVRPAGREPVVTFGRTPGEPLAHVQLDAPTVSRMHARMHFLHGEWRIVNLSHTNPVVVNGMRLNGDTSDGRLLEDGDVVEMGEVSFRFRMP